ncbi:hypothetical protein OC845_001832 [Tilletia horrida]|nr:hypothetical protein OC845_001832 [Tilletia horrida]
MARHSVTAAAAASWLLERRAHTQLGHCLPSVVVLPSCSATCSVRHSSSSSSASSTSSSTTLDDLHRLLHTVIASYPHEHTLRMPTRLAPRQTWVELTQSKLKERQATGAAAPTEEEEGSSIAPGGGLLASLLGGGKKAASGQNKAESALSEAMLAPKPMSASYVEMYLPFSSSPSLVEKYIATSGLVRLGLLFQDLDTLAGACSYQHVLGAQPREGDSSNPVYIVTASVDRLDMLEPLRPELDYRLCGQVIYTGSSSLEVLVTVDQIESTASKAPGEYPKTVKTCLTGRFTMAARNALTRRAQKIPPLMLNTEAERALFAVGEELKARKREHSLASLERVPPTQAESALLHQQYLEDEVAFAQQAGKEVAKLTTKSDAQVSVGFEPVPASSTVLTSSAHMHPSHRNVHAKVFGGFLMRHAYELAWMCAALFKGGSSSASSTATSEQHPPSAPASGAVPVQFLALDTLSFHAPVEIGAMLTLTARVDYSEHRGGANAGDESLADAAGEDINGDGHAEDVAAVSVLAEVTNIATGETTRTNTFRFSFALASFNGNGQGSGLGSMLGKDSAIRRRRVSPRSYAEAMEWIDGRRRIAAGREVRRGLR